MRLTWLPDVISDAGLTVKVETGWTSRGYEFTEPVSGIVIHHTATPASAPGDYPTLRIVRDGRSDLPGPLAQLGLGRSGTVYVIAAGRANHAGKGSYPAMLGNRDTIGIEAEHPGTISHPWPTAQLAAYYQLCAALADRLDLSTDRIIGHKEWAPSRKIDPAGIDMSHFRDSVQALRDRKPRRPRMFLPLTRVDAADRKSDVAAIAYLLNAAYGTRIPGDGSWPVEMVNVLKTRLGEDGTFVTGKMYARLLVDMVKAQGGGSAELPARETVEIVRG